MARKTITVLALELGINPDQIIQELYLLGYKTYKKKEQGLEPFAERQIRNAFSSKTGEKQQKSINEVPSATDFFTEAMAGVERLDRKPKEKSHKRSSFERSEKSPEKPEKPLLAFQDDSLINEIEALKQNLENSISENEVVQKEADAARREAEAARREADAARAETQVAQEELGNIRLLLSQTVEYSKKDIASSKEAALESQKLALIAKRELSKLREELSVVKAALSEARADAGSARAELIRTRLSFNEGEVQDLRDHVINVEAENIRLKESLKAALEIESKTNADLKEAIEQIAKMETLLKVTPEEQPIVEAGSVVDALKQRGLIGLDEFTNSVSMLLKAHMLDSVFPTFETQYKDQFLRVLLDRLCFVCDDEHPLPEGLIPIKVAQTRCEICAGGDLNRSLKRFSDACLLLGFRRVAWIDGWRRIHSIYQEGMDKRLELRTFNSWQPNIEDELSKADLVVLRKDSRTDLRMVELCKGKSLIVEEIGPAAALDKATEILSGPDPGKVSW